MSDIKLRPVQVSAPSRPVPASTLLKPWVFDYAPSPDGKDVNLLIMFHGLGDNKAPFFQLAKSLNLPSTAILSLQGPLMVPLMETPDYWSWYNTFDPMFNPLPNPDPSTTIKRLRQLLTQLISSEVGWDLTQIHLFGWGQGGTTALELAYNIGRKPLVVKDETRTRLGSVVSVCGPLLSHPTSPEGVATPIVLFSRQDPRSAAAQRIEGALKRAFREVEVIQGGRGGEGMPKGRDEWKEIMAFWGRVLGRDEGWKGQGDVYEVVR